MKLESVDQLDGRSHENGCRTGTGCAIEKYY